MLKGQYTAGRLAPSAWPATSPSSRAKVRSAATLVEGPALTSEEQVLDLADDPRAVQRTLDGGGVDERALGGLQNGVHIVEAEHILLDKNLERRHGDRSANHGRSKRAAEGSVG